MIEEEFEDNVAFDGVMEKWLVELKLENPSPAKVILQNVISHNIKNSLSISTDEKNFTKFLESVEHDLARVLILQMEMRGLVQDIPYVDYISSSIKSFEKINIAKIMYEDLGSIDSLVHNIDGLLRTRICKECDQIIPGIPHGEVECKRNIDLSQIEEVTES